MTLTPHVIKAEVIPERRVYRLTDDQLLEAVRDYMIKEAQSLGDKHWVSVHDSSMPHSIDRFSGVHFVVEVKP